jgi:peptidoglycan/LPS O-acetylase OafA/YrhL
VALELNNSLWTIRYEVGCYLGLALAGAAGLLRRPRIVAAVFLAVLVLHGSDVQLPANKLLTALIGALVSWPRLAAFFLAGVVFHCYRRQLPHSRRLAAICVVALGVSLVWPRLLAWTLPVAGTYLLFWIGFHPRIPLNNFGRSGDFSYGTYLYAFPVQQTFVYVLGTNMSPMTLFWLAWPVTLGLAALSWHLVEKRLLKARVRPAAAGAQPAVAGA